MPGQDWQPESGGTEWDFTGPLNTDESAPWDDETLRDAVEADRADRERCIAAAKLEALEAAEKLIGDVTEEQRFGLRQAAIDATIESRRTMAVHRGGRWDLEDEHFAEALHASGDRPEANRIQVWTLDQGEVWVNLYGVRNSLAQMDEEYLLNVIAFLYRSPIRLSRLWIDYVITQNQIDPKFRINHERLKLAKEDPMRWLTRSTLVYACWLEIFKRRGRITNGGAEHVED